MKRIDSTLLGTARHTAAQLLIDTFLATPYGKLARLKLLTDGKAYVPLFLSEQEAKEMTKSMLSSVAQLVEDSGGAVKRAMLMKKYDRIKSQHRFKIPPGDLAGDFVPFATEMEETMMYILRALDSSGYDHILVEKSTCLVSLFKILAQVS